MLKTTVRSECLPGAPPSRHTLYMFRLVYIAAVVLWRTAVGGVDALVPSPHRAAPYNSSQPQQQSQPQRGPAHRSCDLFTDNSTSFIDRYHVNLDKRFSELIVCLDILVVFSIRFLIRIR